MSEKTPCSSLHEFIRGESSQASIEEKLDDIIASLSTLERMTSHQVHIGIGRVEVERSSNNALAEILSMNNRSACA